MFLADKLNKGTGSPVDAQFNYVTMLLHGDGTNGAQNNTFVDSSTNNYTITRTGNTTQGSFSPYGSNWSVFFPNLASNLVVANSTPLNLSGGSFTIEGWINPLGIYTSDGQPNGLQGYNTIIAKRGYGTNAAWGVYLNTGNGYIGFYNQSATYTSTTTPTAGVWSHFAFVFDGTNASLYLNGSRIIGPSSFTNTDYNESIAIGCTTQSGSNEQFRGSISNLRVTKGGALYSGSTHTVPTAPLTTTVSSGTVSLLTCQSNRFIDNSVNNATITVNTGLTVSTYGYASVQRFNPFGASTAYSTSVIGGSAYYDGSGDYLTTVSTPANFGTGNFTAEAWVWFNSNSSGYQPVLANWNGTDQRGWIIIMETNNYIYAYASNGSNWTYNISTTYKPAINCWTHIAYVRNGSTLTLYANGVSIGTASISTNSMDPVDYFSPGYYPFFPGGARSFNGYFSDVRLVKGTAVYTSNFTPPSAPLTAVTNTSLLLGMTNGAIFDNAMTNDLETVGVAQISTSVKKYGTGSISFGSVVGNDNYLLAPATPNLEFGSGDFTIEFWWYPISTARQALYHGSFGVDWSIGIDYSSVSTNQKIGIWASSNGTSWNLINADPSGNGIGTTTLTQNAWNHIAFVRNGTTWMLFVNGNRDLNLTSISGSIVDRSAYKKGINVWWAASAGVNEASGYMDDFRITKGYARYTANFTPPTAAFPNTGPI